MRPRSTLRFAVALFVCVNVGNLLLAPAMEAGHRGLAGWGMVAAVLLTGFGLALLFTAVYDGPRAVTRLLRPVRATRAGGT